jgi:very-short-patch-repair endonuclease
LLSYGDDAVLSHLWAAALHGIRPGPPADVDVTPMRGRRRVQPGINLHRARALDTRDIAIVHGFRVTAVPRLLLDLTDVLPPREVERSLDEAIGLRRTTPRQVRAVLGRSPGRRGLPLLAELLDRDYTARTRSEFEDRMLSMIREAGLPHPQVNAAFGPFLVDFLWPEASYAVEADSRDWHSTVERQRRDRRKDRHLEEHGVQVRRVRWHELEEERLALAVEIASAVVARSAAQGLRPREPPDPR